MMQLRQAPVAQLDRVFDYESKGRGFESLLACQENLGNYLFLRFSFLFQRKAVSPV